VQTDPEKTYQEWLGDVTGPELGALLRNLFNHNPNFNSIQKVTDLTADHDVAIYAHFTKDGVFSHLVLSIAGERTPWPTDMR
jgi:hypothetical protein